MRFLQTFAVLSLMAVVCFADDFAERLYKAGLKAERAGDRFHAYLLFARAAALDPGNVEYAMRKATLQTAERMSLQEQLGRDPADHSSNMDAVDLAPLTGNDLLDARELRPPPRLKVPQENKSFNLKGDAQMIFEKVFEAYGLLVVFDRDYQAPPPFTFRVNEVTAEDAFRALEAASNSFLVPVNERLALVIRDTPQKRTEMVPTMAIAIPIPERVSVQDASDMMAAVQQVFELRKISLDPMRRTIFLRDQAWKIEAAQAMIATLCHERAQVEVEVKFISVEKNSSLAYGLQLQNSFPITNLSTKYQTTPYIPSGFTNFLTFGGGAAFMGIGVASSALLATISKSSTDTLLDARVMALDGQAASLHVGEKYPIITASYSGAAGTGSSSANTAAAPPNVSFEDLGLVLKITPTVNDHEEVSLDVSAEFKVLGTTSENGIPVIANRKYEGKIRLKTGELAVVAGLVSVTESFSNSGFLGLANLPLVGRWLRENHHDTSSTDVLLLLKPRLVALPPWEYVSKPIWVGTETKSLTMY